MNANVLNETLGLLGLKVREEFKLKEYPDYTFIIDENTGLMYRDAEMVGWGFAEAIDVTLFSLITGDYTIVRDEFEPSYGKTYYHPSDNNWTKYVQEVWSNTPSDFAYKAAGMVFSTKGECVYALRTLKDKFVAPEDD